MCTISTLLSAPDTNKECSELTGLCGITCLTSAGLWTHKCLVNIKKEFDGKSPDLCTLIIYWFYNGRSNTDREFLNDQRGILQTEALYNIQTTCK